VARLRERFERAGQNALDHQSERLAQLSGLLRTLGPESAFQRGFSITLGSDGKIVSSATALKPGELMRTKFADGETQSIVKEWSPLVPLEIRPK
jgi:exodeoxyribonuclease VII large subunit